MKTNREKCEAWLNATYFSRPSKSVYAEGAQDFADYLDAEATKEAAVNTPATDEPPPGSVRIKIRCKWKQRDGYSSIGCLEFTDAEVGHSSRINEPTHGGFVEFDLPPSPRFRSCRERRWGCERTRF